MGSLKIQCIAFICSMCLAICVTIKSNAQNQSAEPTTFFFLGDAGEINEHAAQNLQQLQKDLSQTQGKKVVVILGDNIYPHGMPAMDTKDRLAAEEIMNAQLKAIKDQNAEIIVIPGNHDWAKGRKRGLKHIGEQEEFIEAQFNNEDIFKPSHACPGPEVVDINDQMVMVILDSQWLLHLHNKPGEDSDCENKTRLDVYSHFIQILKQNKSKHVIVAAHHPIVSYGEHGGRFTARQHIFPLTDVAKWLYLPLPVIGSIYPLYRKFLGNIQDLSHPLNKAVTQSLAEVMEAYSNIVYVSGHEHNLQYNYKNNVHYVVSGSGSKSTHVKKKSKYGKFASESVGYAKIIVDTKGSTQLSFVPINDSIQNGPLNHTLIQSYQPEKLLLSDIENNSDTIRKKFIETQASNKYIAGKRKRRWLGNNYREIWSLNLNVPVFDIQSEKGGLTIVQRGGGFQTKSLRLEHETGRQYVLRSIDKNTEKAVPSMFRGTFAQDIVQDQISAAHPYAAFVVPELAEAAKIYHTNPQLMYIPNDPAFGLHQEDFANTLVLFEERPSRNWSDASFFGHSPKIINTAKVVSKIQKDNDNYVDQKFVLRNRLFDVVIGDWDRHDDQWRWATMDTLKGQRYRPIPRDRDQAFFVNDGIIPKIASRKWAIPKIQGFDTSISNIEGFMFNARWFDRSFLTEPSKEEWLEVAHELQQNLSDDKIEAAIGGWSPEIHDLTGKTVINKLKKRRDRLPEYAEKYYAFLAKEVDVVGSNKRELVEIERLDSGLTRVSMFKVNKSLEKKRLMYDRTFDRKETKEVRVYTMGGKDHIRVFGEGKKGMKLRLIGGTGKDTFVDSSNLRGWSNKTIIYDTKKKTVIDKSAGTRIRTSNRPDINEYDRKAFKYDLVVPLVVGNWNVDDGLFVGGGFMATKHGFRKEPYKSRHLVLGMGAFLTGAFDFRYKGTFNHLIGRNDLLISADVEGPNYSLNFYGMGNESVYDQSNELEYYRVRFDNIFLKAYMRRRFSESVSIAGGLVNENVDIRDTKDKFIEQEDLADLVNRNLFEQKRYAGVGLNFTIDSRDNNLLTKRGIHLKIDGKSLAGINDNSRNYSAIHGSFAFYYSFRSPSTVTISNRIGGGMSFGDFEFFQANTLGGTGKIRNLRGYRRTRFYGEQAVYNNTELRFKLFGFRTYLFPSEFGLLGFYDIGRVWIDNEDSDVWHDGYGGGIWLAPFESFVVAFSIAVGEEDLRSLTIGFLF